MHARNLPEIDRAGKASEHEAENIGNKISDELKAYIDQEVRRAIGELREEVLGIVRLNSTCVPTTKSLCPEGVDVKLEMIRDDPVVRQDEQHCQWQIEKLADKVADIQANLNAVIGVFEACALEEPRTSETVLDI